MTSGTSQSAAPALAANDPPRPQIAALCWRLRKGRVQVLLITSRETRRWVIPKGWPMEGRLGHEAAELEAWEEAGVKGAIDARALGQFGYDKLHPFKPAQRCEVTVYPLRVARLEARFPEAGQRQRKWFSAKSAARMVAEGGLAELFRSAGKTLPKS